MASEDEQRAWHWWETPFIALIVYWFIRGDTPEQVTARLERWLRI